MPRAGDLKDRYAFQRRAAGGLVNGVDQPDGDWQTQFTCAAQTRYLKGGEGVQAARLQGDQPVILTIRTCVAAKRVDSTWQAVDVRLTPQRVFDVTSAAPNIDPAFIDVLAVLRGGQPGG